MPLATDKQKMLLSDDVGHFSLIRAMHLADLITLMNGTVPIFFFCLASSCLSSLGVGQKQAFFLIDRHANARM